LPSYVKIVSGNGVDPDTTVEGRASSWTIMLLCSQGKAVGMRLHLAAVPVLVLLSIQAPCEGAETPRVDPQTGLVRVLFMGDALMGAGFVTPMIALDPMVKLTPVPVEFITFQYASVFDAAASLRMYVPRTEQRMREEYDVVIIADAREPFFPPNIQAWIKNGVIEGGMGFLMGGGPQSFSGQGEANPSWDPSAVADILPCKLTGESWGIGPQYYLVPAKGYEDHPLVRKIPWRQCPLFAHQRVGERPGCVVVGRSDRNPPDSPIVIYMEMGEGRTEAFVFDWGGNGPQLFHRWEYGPLFMSNLIYYAARVSIPEDVSLFLKLRTQLTSFHVTRSFAISVIDFAEKFGANLRKAETELGNADVLRRQVVRLYIQGDYEESLVALGKAFEKMAEVTDIALKAKDEALLWVYVIEWFTVSGTSMVTGFILWTLMVRRAAYKPVGVTRFQL